jgi:hypothetical protein
MKIVYAIIGAVFVAVVAVASFQFLAIKRTEVINAARFECAQSSRYQVTTNPTTTVWYPMEEMYNTCLFEKGIK